jgi:hypothetical protein
MESSGQFISSAKYNLQQNRATGRVSLWGIELSPLTSRELLIAGRLIAGAPKSNLPVVILPLADSPLFASDKVLSPAHRTSIRQRYGWGAYKGREDT